MTVVEQLHTLHRQFPRATELAVTPEQAAQFESEVVPNLRFRDHPITLRTWPVELLPGGLRVQRLPLRFRNAQLTMVCR